MISVKDALNYIDPTSTDYKTWLSYGMALKQASKSDSSITYLDWDVWSQRDSRPKMYREGLCKKKWESFQSTGITEATIFHDALMNGYHPRFDGTEPLRWDSVITFDGSDKNSQISEIIQYFNLLFKPDDIVNYCFAAFYDESKDKYSPASNGINRKAKDIIEDLEKYQDVSLAMGDYNPQAGGWIRFNPTDGKGAKNSNIKDFRYCLVESDKISLDEQLKKILDLKLPCAAIVYSGAKSLHAIVKVDAKNQEEYTKRVKWIYEVLNENDFPIDQNNKNPSRMSRLPGLSRGNKQQSLVKGAIGLNSFAEWEDYIKNDMEDEILPEIVSYADIINNPPPLKEELISGVLRQGHKMIIAGASKSGKSFSLIDLSTSIAEGKDWIGFECKQGKVLYLNFEIDEASFWERVRLVYEAKGWEPTPENLEVWTLRGYSMSAQKLIPKIIKRAYSKDYSLIVLDPIYKIQAGDENSAGDIAKFTNEIDKLVTELNCSVVYCHHHSKGSQGFKKAMDRSSGSGVFSRDADAIIDVIELSNESFQDIEGYSDLRAFRVEGTLREFPSFEPVNVFYDFPIYKVDKAGILNRAKTLDEFLLNRQNFKPDKRKQPAKERFEHSFNKLSLGSKKVPIKELTNDLNIKERQLRNIIHDYNKKMGSEIFTTRKGEIVKL